MTVAELIKELKTLNPKSLVVMSSDGEGNSHSPLSGYFTGIYIPDSTWSGDVFDDDEVEKIKAGDEDYADYADYEIPKNPQKCIVLYPTN